MLNLYIAPKHGWAGTISRAGIYSVKYSPSQVTFRPGWDLFFKKDLISSILMNICKCEPQSNETKNCLVQSTVRNLK